MAELEGRAGSLISLALIRWGGLHKVMPLLDDGPWVCMLIAAAFNLMQRKRKYYATFVAFAAPNKGASNEPNCFDKGTSGLI
jgi:hypothetical protein